MKMPITPSWLSLGSQGDFLDLNPGDFDTWRVDDDKFARNGNSGNAK